MQMNIIINNINDENYDYRLAGEDEMCSFLTNAGIVCPEPELNIYGQRGSLQELPIETTGFDGKNIHQKSGG